MQRTHSPRPTARGPAPDAMAATALWRAESRGTHYRLDCPGQREEFRFHDVWQRGEKGPMKVPVKASGAA